MRVIAFASKRITKFENNENLNRKEYETNLEFIGFMVLENKLKEATN
jgi:magnesium-transporting ATPase (P-type)